MFTPGFLMSQFIVHLSEYTGTTSLGSRSATAIFSSKYSFPHDSCTLITIRRHHFPKITREHEFGIRRRRKPFRYRSVASRPAVAHTGACPRYPPPMLVARECQASNKAVLDEILRTAVAFLSSPRPEGGGLVILLINFWHNDAGSP